MVLRHAGAALQGFGRGRLDGRDAGLVGDALLHARHHLVQDADPARGIGGARREIGHDRIEARIVLGEALVAQPERRRQRRRLGVAQPLVGAAEFIGALDHDLDALVRTRHGECGDGIAVPVGPFDHFLVDCRN